MGLVGTASVGTGGRSDGLAGGGRLKGAGASSRSHDADRAACWARRRFPLGARFRNDALCSQGRLAGRDLSLDALVLGFPRRLRLAVFPLDLPLFAAFLLPLLVRPYPFGPVLAAFRGRIEPLLGFRPLLHGHGARRLAVQIVAPIPRP